MMRARFARRLVAGTVSKTFGAIFTLLGGLGLVAGLVAFGWGLLALEQETERAFPDERRMELALAGIAAGLSAAGLGFLLLLAGLPLLIYGVHRVLDPATGRTRTAPGGALKAWGIALLVLGVAALLVGLLSSAFGAGVMDEETRRLFPNDDRAEMAAMLAAGALAVAALGFVFVIAGLPLLLVGVSRARAAQPAHPAAATPEASSAAVVLGVVAGAVALGFLLMLVFTAAGPASGVDDAGGRATTAVFNGSIEGGGAPVLGTVGAGGERSEHLVTPETRRGVVQVGLEWDPATARGPLALLVEASTGDGGWREIARAEGGSPLAASSGAEPLPGDVRVTVSFGAGSGGAVQYGLVVNVSPA